MRDFRFLGHQRSRINRQCGPPRATGAEVAGPPVFASLHVFAEECEHFLRLTTEPVVTVLEALGRPLDLVPFLVRMTN